ncbi:50S ribosomal protein L25 [Patescibacteria group bacterium]|nr:50S ribosomal protein L25 [Patescibacteria group bacterium]MBU0776715.1 50S ribosomal protein L25 [Patescibacteria group bacterium]MBU0846159.1 50S ribosomal protein L25 [Patescibacteria group bacterium]MBU0922752.1 50S ribosomal protein L25 [Patescibacteria group bacterium]MBU1066269.1 50S ribosomal protein L25 [Patescibacteria group bacterium]
MDKHTLKATKRKILGQKVKTLRKEGILPANIYGKKVKSLAIQIPLSEFEKVYKEAGETGIVEIAVDSTKRPVLINNIQRHPVSDFPLHVDFLQIDLKEKVTADVPIDLIGESPAEKSGLGTVVQYINEIEVEALPANLPEKFEIDLSKLTEVDKAVLVKDLTVDTKKVEIKSDLEQVLVKVEPPRKEEEIIAPVETEVEGEEVEEGEEPLEGDKAPVEGEEVEKKEEKTEDKTEKKVK